MKKLLFQVLFLLLILPAMSQVYINISGYVTDSVSGTAIPDHAVFIVSDSSFGFIYYNTVLTNSNGFYTDTVPVPTGSSGTLYIQTYGCYWFLHQDTVNFNPSNTNFTVNFSICNSNPPCQADFGYTAYANGYVDFFDNSTGNPDSWNWAFGDGGTSTQQDPVHQYSLGGWHTVTLTISNSSTGCQSTYVSSIYSSGSGGGCQAYYTYSADPTNSNMYYFFDQSSGNILYWSWNFGDPGSGTNNTSSSENPIHIFTGLGTYSVCLTIQGADSACFDTYCLNIVINGSGGCQAYFYDYADSTDNRTIHFVDQSVGNISTWAWYFGDGTSQTISYPANPNVSHTYPGSALSYVACLYIQGYDSTCFGYHCDTIVIGSGGGCLANFTYSVSPNTSTPTQFEDLSQASGGGQITLWNWNFGDPGSGTANISNLQNPTHLFSAAGSYTVCLTIQGPDSTCYDFICKPIMVGSNAGCQADFTYYADSMYASNPIHFIDQSIGNIISWAWNFGDGSPLSSLQNPIHYYPAPGAYTVCLTIQGADSSCYDVTCKTVIVGNNTGCQSQFTFTPGPAGTASSIQFIDQSTGNPNNWMWSFGDSTYSTEQNPIHIYPGPGTYLACLTITANNGTNCTSTSCQNVVVADSVVYHQVYGQVFAGNVPIQLGLALIFSLDSNLNYLPYIDVCSIDSMGFYHFNTVPDGNYLVVAIPFDSNGYLPTYYGDVLNWAEATVIALGEPNNPYNINLIQAGYMPVGPGSVGGQVNMGNLKSSMMDKMTMLLLDEEGQAISFDRVSESGSFAFPTMDYGTYYLHAELSGITSDNVKVVLTPEKPHVDVVMTFEGKNILGINNTNPVMEAGVIYPNPANNKFNLVLNLKEGETVKVEIFNQRGQITSSMMKSLDSGKNVLTLSVSELAPGFYTLRLTSENGINISQKLLIAK